MREQPAGRRRRASVRPYLPYSRTKPCAPHSAACDAYACRLYTAHHRREHVRSGSGTVCGFFVITIISRFSRPVTSWLTCGGRFRRATSPRPIPYCPTCSRSDMLSCCQRVYLESGTHSALTATNRTDKPNSQLRLRCANYREVQQQRAVVHRARGPPEAEHCEQAASLVFNVS